MDDKMTPAGVAMMQSLVNMVGCDCPKEENSDYRNEEGCLCAAYAANARNES